MKDTVDKVAESLARLEVTVAEGFYANNQRFDAIDRRFDGVDQRLHEAELRDIALSNKIDANTESLRAEIRAMRAESVADRSIMIQVLQQHGTRIAALEKQPQQDQSGK